MVQTAVVAVSRSASHTFSKDSVDCIQLLAGLGVEGDTHSGATVKHQHQTAQNATRPNLRQVHLVHEELFAELADKGFPGLAPGQIGENVTTRGIDLLSLPQGSKLKLGGDAVVEVTGVRTPCKQLNNFQDGLMQACLERGADNKLVRRSGVMGIVLEGGQVSPGDPISVVLPPEPHMPLQIL